MPDLKQQVEQMAEVLSQLTVSSEWHTIAKLLNEIPFDEGANIDIRFDSPEGLATLYDLRIAIKKIQIFMKKLNRVYVDQKNGSLTIVGKENIMDF